MPTPRCAICDVALPPERMGGRYCDVHQRAFEARQVGGVAASDLDERYGDTLATWRGHTALVPDLPAAQLAFRHRQGDWLLFRLTTERAGGLVGQGWRTDWLAVRAAGGEVRRYAHVPEVEVWLDLLGRRALPSQENPVEQWGAPDPVIPATHRTSVRVLGPAPPPRAPDLYAVTATTAVPVYGVPDGAAGLDLSNANIQRWQGRDEIVGLTFTNQRTAPADPGRTEATIGEVRRRLMEEADAWRERHARGPTWASAWTRAEHRVPNDDPPPTPPPPAPPVPTAVLEVRSSYLLSYDVAFPPGGGQFNTDQIGPTLLAGLPAAVRAVLPEERCQAHLLQVKPLLWRYAPDHVAAIAASPARVLRRPLVVAGKPFAAELLAWTGQPPLCAFRLEREDTGPVRVLLSGAAYGIELTSLLALLEQLVVVNDRLALLARYQAALEEQLRS